MSGFSSSSLYETCAVAVTSGNYTTGSEFSGPKNTSTLLLHCLSHRLDTQQHHDERNFHSWLLVLSGALVFVMQAGLAMLCAGCVRQKNVQNTMLKNLLDACGASVAFYVTGFAVAFGTVETGANTSLIGHNHYFSAGLGREALTSDNTIDAAFWFFQYSISSLGSTLVAGTLAERCQMVAYLCYSMVFAGFVYPVAARALWSEYGLLSAFRENPLGGIGCIDYAGSGVVHVTGGTTALIAAYLLGPRKGRFTDSRGRTLETPKPFPGHSIALQLMGTMILWFGCTYFVCDRFLRIKLYSHSLSHILQGMVLTLGRLFSSAFRMLVPWQLSLLSIRLCQQVWERSPHSLRISTLKNDAPVTSSLTLLRP